MKVLLITSDLEDYLQDSVIHGFKEMLGQDAWEYPVKPMLYNDFISKSTIRGNGFTLYGTLDKSLKPANTKDIREVLEKGDFDAVIFTSIHRQYGLFYQLLPLLKKLALQVLILDGEDTDMLFPFLNVHFKKPFLWFSVKPHKHFTYLKRELSGNTIQSYHYRLLPQFVAKRLPLHKNIHPISFSIPAGKIVDHIPPKSKTFSAHIVDEEVARQVNGGKTGYSFNTEEDYYADLQRSRFGITAKRGGWDCLRHYEMAANGTVLCFKELEKKPVWSAPHGLVPGYNCLSYSNYQDLMGKINDLTEENYTRILHNSISWIRMNSTIQMARGIVQRFLTKGL